MPRVIPHPRSPRNAQWAILIDFATNQADLRPEHIEWLDREVVPPLQSDRPPWVYLRGYASRRGNEGVNVALSERRVQSVLLHLLGFPVIHPGRFRSFTGLDAVGETQSGGGERDNSARWRAVEVVVTPQRLPQERSVPRLPTRTVQRRVRCHLERNPRMRSNLEPGWSEGGPAARFSEQLWRNSRGSVRGRLSCDMQHVPIHHRVIRITHRYVSHATALATMDYLEVEFAWGEQVGEDVELVWEPNPVQSQTRRARVSRHRAAEIYTNVHLYLQNNDPWY